MSIAAERPDGRGRERAGRRRVGEIGRDRDGPDAVAGSEVGRELVEDVRPPRREGEVATLFREAFRDRPPEAARGATDERAPPANPEIHPSSPPSSEPDASPPSVRQPRPNAARRDGTSGLFPPAPERPMLGRVEGNSPAHELPELYRTVLERVGALEQTGHRREAEHIRREAVTAYSRAWDDAARRRLLQLRARAERRLAPAERTRSEPATPHRRGEPAPRLRTSARSLRPAGRLSR